MEVGIYTFARKHNREIEKCGSSLIRGKWYVDNWPEAEYYREGKKYDVMIFQKVWWEEKYKLFDGIKILDLCDPEWINGGWDIRYISTLVDAIVVSSKGLYKSLSKLMLDCELLWIDDRIDLEWIGKHKKKHTDDIAKKVSWYGYSGNGLDALKPVIPYIAKYDLELNLIADKSLVFPSIETRIKNKKHSWDNIIFDLLETDFVLNPPLNNNLSQYKSFNKTYLAWALGLPVAHKLSELMLYVNNPEERKKEGEKAYKLVREKYDIKQSIKQYKELINTLYDKRKNSNGS